MSSQQQQQEIVQQFNILQQQYNTLINRAAEIDSDRREHESVAEVLKKMEGGRKCWRLVAGVLTERVVSEVLPAVENNAKMLGEAVSSLEKQIEEKQKELLAFKTRYNIRFRGEQEKSGESAAQQPKKAQQGVLA